MGHSVSQQGKAAGEKRAAQKQAERSPEQILKDIRSSLQSGLSVTPLDIKWLLERYDSLKATLQQNVELLQIGTESLQSLGKEMDELKAENEDLRVKNEDFRQVYEMENSRTTVKVERVVAMSPGGANELVSES